MAVIRRQGPFAWSIAVALMSLAASSPARTPFPERPTRPRYDSRRSTKPRKTPSCSPSAALGGVFAGDSAFYAPYLTERFPPDVDPFEGLVAIGSGVPARRAPDPGAAVVRTLSWEVVLRDREADRARQWPEGWTAIRLPEGEAAWVETRSVRSPIDYRAYFARRDGRWWLETFVAGD